jgi:hypothetical protein
MIRSQPHTSDDRSRPSAFGLRPINLGLLALGVVTIAIGYVLLGRGSTVAAPLLLVVGYAGLVPAGLLVGFRRAGASDSERGE